MSAASHRVLHVGLFLPPLLLAQPTLAAPGYDLPQGYTEIQVRECSPPNHIELGAQGGRFDCQSEFTFNGQRFWIYNNWVGNETNRQSVLAVGATSSSMDSVGRVVLRTTLKPFVFQGNRLRIVAVASATSYYVYDVTPNATTGRLGLTQRDNVVAGARTAQAATVVTPKPWTERAAPNDPMFSSIYHLGNFRYRCMRYSSGSNLMNAEDIVIHYKNGTTVKQVKPYWLAHRGPACDPQTGKALDPHEEYIFPWGIGRTGP